MALTLEDLDRRLTVLELGQSARIENAIVRLDQEVKAIPRVVAEMVAESEQRTRTEVSGLRGEVSGLRGEVSGLRGEVSGLRAEMKAESQRVLAVVNAAEQRTAGLINDSEQRLLAAIDRLHNPPV